MARHTTEESNNPYVFRKAGYHHHHHAKNQIYYLNPSPWQCQSNSCFFQRTMVFLTKLTNFQISGPAISSIYRVITNRKTAQINLIGRASKDRHPREIQDRTLTIRRKTQMVSRPITRISFHPQLAERTQCTPQKKTHTHIHRLPVSTHTFSNGSRTSYRFRAFE